MDDVRREGVAPSWPEVALHHPAEFPFMDSSKTPDQSPKVIRTLPFLGPVYLFLTHTGLPGPKPSSASLSPLGKESHSQTLPPGAGSLDNVSLQASKLPWCLRVFPALVSYSQPFLPGATPLVSGSSLQELSHSLHSFSCSFLLLS